MGFFGKLDDEMKNPHKAWPSYASKKFYLREKTATTRGGQVIFPLKIALFLPNLSNT